MADEPKTPKTEQKTETTTTDVAKAKTDVKHDVKADKRDDTRLHQVGKEAQREPEKYAKADAPVFFEGTITKIDKDGNEVLSDHILPGEKLRRDVTEVYNTTPRDADKDEDADTHR